MTCSFLQRDWITVHFVKSREPLVVSTTTTAEALFISPLDSQTRSDLFWAREDGRCR
jgi:hypothetical protein